MSTPNPAIPAPPIPDDCWTYRERQVLLVAAKEAGRLRHDFVGTEHLLLGLTQCGGVAGDILKVRRLDARIIGEYETWEKLEIA